MPLTENQRRDESLRHTTAKHRIAKKLDIDLAELWSREGLTEGLIAILMGVALVILGFLLAPEPVITKITAILIALGLSIFAAFLVLYIVTKSQERMRALWRGFNRKEELEDERHKNTLNG